MNRAASFIVRVFTPATGGDAKTVTEMQADAVETAVCSWPDTAVFMCDRFETRDADSNGDDVINAADAVTEETFVVSCNTGYRCRGPHLSVTADGVWSAAPTWRDVRDREVYRVSYRAVAVTTPVTPVTTAQKQYEAVVAAAGCDTDGAGASTPGLWCETFPTTDAGSLVTGSTLVVSCVSGFRCVRPRVTVTDGTYTAAVSAQEIVPAAQQPLQGRPVAARISSVRITVGDLGNDAVDDVLVNGQSRWRIREIEPHMFKGELVCAVTGFSWYGDPRDPLIAPSSSGPWAINTAPKLGPYRAGWLDEDADNDGVPDNSFDPLSLLPTEPTSGPPAAPRTATRIPSTVWCWNARSMNTPTRRANATASTTTSWCSAATDSRCSAPQRKVF